MSHAKLGAGVAALAIVVLPSACFAAKSYQVTGTVAAVSQKNITVQKGDEKWEIAKPEKMKVEGGKLEVGKEVTIKYEMSAKGIEIRSGSTAAMSQSGAATAQSGENQPVTPVEKVASGAVKTTEKVVRSPGMPIEKTGQVAGKVLEAPGKAVGNVAPTAGKVLEVPGQAVAKTGEVAGTVVDKTAEGAGNLIRNPIGTIGGAMKKTGEAVENTAEKVMGTEAK